MDRTDRSVAAVLAVVTAALGLALTRTAMVGAPRGWWPIVLVGLGAAYVTLAGLLTWQVCVGVPPEGYLSGDYRWAILARQWLGTALLFPVLLLAYATRLMRRSIYREIEVAGRDRGEKVRRVVFEAGGGGAWVLSNRAVYVVSPKGVFWRAALLSQIQSVTHIPRGPWARAQVVLAIAAPSKRGRVLGTFTLRDARRVQRYLDELGAAAGARG